MSRWLAPLALLLTACTGAPANKAAPDQPPLPAKTEPAKPEPTKTEPTKPEPAKPEPPTPEPATPEPSPPAAVEPAAPGEPPTSWWCVCYARTTATGGEPVTACRATEAACHGLERAVATGRSGMVARSLTHPCQTVTGAHPGDAYGGREGWQPSKKAGGWLSLGECKLPGEGQLVQAEESGPDIDDELGPLKWGLAAEEVIKAIGEPGKRGRIELEEATGTYVQDWDYEDQGVFLAMGSTKRKGPQHIHRMTITAPSTLTTPAGVGIGSPRKAVLAAYGKFRDPYDPSGDNDEVFVAGSVYGGIFFTMEADKVTEIFVGAGAE